MSARSQRWKSNLLPPLLLLLVTIIAWQLLVWLLDMKPYVLPAPSAVARAAVRDYKDLLAAVWLTGQAAGLGLLISISLGTITALLFSQSQLIRRSFYPYAIALQTVPVVAIAPLIVIWFEEGFHSVVLVTVIISLFPVITSVTTGLTSIDQGQFDLFSLNHASRWQQLFKLRVPSAVPYLVTGARTAAGLAVVGAIVGEFFVGSIGNDYGLGYLILNKSGQMETEMLFATMIASALLGVMMFVVVTWIGFQLLARWTFTLQQK